MKKRKSDRKQLIKPSCTWTGTPGDRLFTKNKDIAWIVCFFCLGILLIGSRTAYGREYAVERGETSLQIAIDNNLTMAQLKQLNPDLDLEMMKVGEIMILPDEGLSFEEFLEKLYSDKLRVDNLKCYALVNGSAACYFFAENISDLPLYDVTLKASVTAANGARGEAENALPLMQILPREKFPFYLRVPGHFDTVDSAEIHVLNLRSPEMLNSSFRIDASTYTEHETYSPDRISGTMTILFLNEGIAAYQDRQINVHLSAYDQDGNLIGVRSLYTDFYPRLDITVYSSGPIIASLELRMEAY